jgi:hypothetical protein
MVEKNEKTKTRTREIIEEWKPRILFLVIGLVLGPFITNWLGWQVTAGTMESAVEEAVVAYRAGLCAERARSDSEATSDVLKDYSARRKLAEKWAVLPGEETTLPAVVNECSSRLAE